MSQCSGTAALLHEQSLNWQYQDPINKAEQVIDGDGWAVFHLSNARNHTGVKFVLGNNSLVEVKVMKQPDNSVVLSAILKGSTSASSELDPNDQANHGFQIQEEEKQQQEMRNDDNNNMTEEEWVKQMRGWLMVLATLVLSVTYQAGINPPVKREKDPKNYVVFKGSNTMAMAQSIIIIFLIIKRRVFKDSSNYVHALRILVITSIFALATAYSASCPGDFVPLMFYMIFANVLLVALLQIAIRKWSGYSMRAKTATIFKILVNVIVSVSSMLLTVLYVKKRWPPMPWYSSFVCFIFVVITITWLY